MKPYIINVINSVILITIGLWGYWGSASPSPTALIPVFVGVLLLLLTKWMKDGNKVIAHIVVTITFVMLVALFKPLSGAISRGDSMAVTRVTIMIISCAYASIMYIKSFIDVRKNRNSLN